MCELFGVKAGRNHLNDPYEATQLQLDLVCLRVCVCVCVCYLVGRRTGSLIMTGRLVLRNIQGEMPLVFSFTART